MNIYDYVVSFKDSFASRPFNDVDSLVLSVIMYLDFTGIVPNNRVAINLASAGEVYLNTYTIQDINKLGIAQRNAYRLLKLVVKSPRYKDILLSNYRYITSLDSQFSAMMFKISKDLIFVGFEGTDELLAGWKEDAYLAFRFPVDAQRYAIDYLNEVIKIFDKKIIVAGHSKGGNLALVSSMFAHFYIKNKIVKVISFDGPGLRKEEYNSRQYKKIRAKYVHIIPTHSLVGTLLYNDEYCVVKCTKHNILAHDPCTWVISGEKLVKGKQDKKSQLIEKKLNEYISSISYEEQERVIRAIFGELEHDGYKTINEFLGLRRLLKTINKLRNIDAQAKTILSDVFEIIINNYL